MLKNIIVTARTFKVFYSVEYLVFQSETVLMNNRLQLLPHIRRLNFVLPIMKGKSNIFAGPLILPGLPSKVAIQEQTSVVHNPIQERPNHYTVDRDRRQRFICRSRWNNCDIDDLFPAA